MNLKFCSLCLGMSLAVTSLVFAGNTTEPQAQISLRIDTVSVSPDSATVTIPIWLDNPGDTLAGFEVWIRFSRPGILIFDTTIDSIYDTLYWNCLAGVWPACTDSELVIDTSAGFDFISEQLFEVNGATFDTSGTLISGWQFMSAGSLGGQALDMKIVGLAGNISPPFNPGLSPQSGGIFFNLIATVLPIPDTLSDRTVDIVVIDVPPDHTSFSDQDGTTLTLELFDGSVTILPPACCTSGGNANGDPSGKTSIADITFLIARIFAAGAAPPCCEEGDADGSGGVNIADVTYLIARIFAGGPAPVCGPAGMGC